MAKRMIALGLVMMGSLGGCNTVFGGGDGGGGSAASEDGCELYEQVACDGGNLHWIDSCGNVGEVAEECVGESVCSDEAQTCCEPGATEAGCGVPAEEPQEPEPEPIPARCSYSFADVSSTSIAADAIRALYVNDVVDGCSSDPLSYCPQDDATRLHAAIMLVNAMGEQPSTAAANEYFCDVSGPYAAYANRLYELGITSGCVTATPCADPDKATFCPGDPARRDHMAVFLVRALGETPSTAATDAYFDDATEAYAGYINKLYELGVTQGCDTRTYCSKDSTLRSQAALFIARGFDLDDSVCTAVE